MIAFLDSAPLVTMLLTAELLWLITRSSQLTILVKRPKQRMQREQRQVDLGLLPELVLQCLVWVPASCLLMFVVLEPFARARFGYPEASPTMRIAFEGALGLASYGFPFAAIRAFVGRVALTTLKEFATLSSPPPSGQQPEGS